MSNEILHINVETYSPATRYYNKDVAFTNSGSAPPTPVYFISVTGGEEPPCGFGTGHAGHMDTAGFTSNDFWKRIGDSSWSLDEIWQPSYSTSIDSEPITRAFQFGDGYEQVTEKGLFYGKMRIQAFFNEMTDVEAKSFLAYLEWHGSHTPVRYQVPELYKERRFIVESFKHSFDAFNTHSINVSFIEAEEEI